MPKSTKAGAMTLATAPDVLTVDEAAKICRLGRNGMYEAIRTGTIPAVKIGKRLLISKKTLEHLFADKSA